jgi:flagellar biosynthesis/type III secretory pathway M-ring protein FliF/YscJ
MIPITRDSKSTVETARIIMYMYIIMSNAAIVFAVFMMMIVLGIGAFIFIRRRQAAKKKEEEAKAAAAAAAAAEEDDEPIIFTPEKEKEPSIEDKKKEIAEKFKASKPVPGASPKQFAKMYFDIVDGNKDDVLDENELSLMPDGIRMNLEKMGEQSKLGIFKDKKLSKSELTNALKKLMNKPRKAAAVARRITPPKRADADLPISKNGRCGPKHGNTRCGGKSCCSRYSWCGGEQGKRSAWCSGTTKGHWGGKFDGR